MSGVHKSPMIEKEKTIFSLSNLQSSLHLW